MTITQLQNRITSTSISKFLLLFIFIFSVVNTNAQTGLNFQGVARNSNNAILASQQISLRLSILQGTATGVAEYTETRTVTTNAQGLFTAVIGDAGATSTLGIFTTINWKNTPKYLKVEMDAAAGTNFTTMGTTQLQYGAYAQFANGVNAANIAGLLPVEKGGTGVASITALKTVLAIDKTKVGLANVDNTSDLLKLISTATQTALNLKANTADVEPIIVAGANNKFWRGDKTWQALPSSLISLNELRDSVQTFSLSTSGVAPSINSNATVHTINLPLASNSLVTAGLLAKSDFDQFYNKSDFSGNYNDLSNKPIIPDAHLQPNWDQSDNTKLDFIKSKPSLAPIAITGSYADLLNSPTITDLNGVAASRNLTINGVTQDLSKDRNWDIDLSTSGMDLSKNIITGILPVNNGGTGSSTLNFLDFTSDQIVGGDKKFTNTISVGTATPELTAIFDINSTSKGFLPPRMTTAQRDAIANPAIGLTIFNTETNCLEWWIGSIWYNACGNKSVSTTTNGTANVSIISCTIGNTAMGVTGGSYTIGQTINSASSWQIIKVKVNKSGTYNFTATANGITFSKMYQFFDGDTAGDKEVYLSATGAALNAGTYTYKLATSPSCEFTANVNATSSNGSSVISSWGASTTPTGTMMNDKLVNDGEVTQTLTANVGTIGTYKILTANNGITFTGAGTFSATGNNEVILTASGTPINAGTYTFTTNTDPAKSFTRNFLSSTSNGTAVITGFTTGASVGNLYVNNLLGTVSQTIVATVTTAGTYSFTASLNGVTFTGSGTITGTGSQNIILQATGTPTTEGNNFYSINSSIPHSFARQTLSSPSSNGTSVVTSWSCATDTSGALYLGNASSYVTQTITADVSQVGTYYISASINGVTFAGSGVFDVTGIQNIKLNATGTPTTFGANNFSLNTSNSCTFTRYVTNNLSSNGTAVVNSYTVGSASGTLYANSESAPASQTIIANVKTIGTYNISTMTNGITYAASGTFNATGNQTITLNASGTPLLIGSYTATINTTPNCSFTSTALAQPSTNGTAIVSSYRINSTDDNVTYYLGVAYSNNYNLTANVTKVGTYNISKTINGLTITASGTFNSIGNQFIYVEVKGTPTSLGNYTISTNNTTISATWNFKVVNKSTGGTASVTSWVFTPTEIYFYPNVEATGTTVTLTGNVTSVGTYNILLSNRNSVYLTGTGTFTNTGYQTITLMASGVPDDIDYHQFRITASNNGDGVLDSYVYNPTSNGTSAISNIRLGSSSGYLEVNKVANKVTQEIKVNVTQIGTYLISAVSNGVTFNASGNFTSIGEKIITLTASGTPTAEGFTRFTLNVTPSLSFTKQVISTVTIGAQVWMKKNLDVATYRNGDPIPKVTDPSIWAGLTTGAYCYYNNDSATYAATYGKLYNWYALNDSRGLDMQGWHLPSEQEFNTLILKYGGSGFAGGALKSTDNSLWMSPNSGATNVSNFSALPGGLRKGNGIFGFIGRSGNFAINAFYETYTGSIYIMYESEHAGLGFDVKQEGYSIRLIKD